MALKAVTAEQVDLWSSQSAGKHSHRIALLKPVVIELARKAGDSGITISDIRLTAVQRGLLAESAKGRELSFLGALCRAAGLLPTDRCRRSVIEVSHGNRQTVWVLPSDQRQSA